MPVEEQVVSIFAGTSGYLDDIPVADVKRFETELLDYMRTRHVDLMLKIRDAGDLPEGDALATAVADFTTNFRASVAGERAAADPAASDAEAVGPEQSQETSEPSSRESEAAWLVARSEFSGDGSRPSSRRRRSLARWS